MSLIHRRQQRGLVASFLGVILFFVIFRIRDKMFNLPYLILPILSFILLLTGLLFIIRTLVSKKTSEKKYWMPKWTSWIIIVANSLFLGGLMLFGAALIFLQFMLSPNSNKAYESVFVNPRTDVQRLRSGGASFQGWDVWLTFTSEKDIQLKDKETFTSLNISEAREKLSAAAELRCQQFMDEADEQNLEFFYKTDPKVSVPNGQFLVHDKLNHHYCYQDWYHN
jgi:hypothetical protein